MYVLLTQEGLHLKLLAATGLALALLFAPTTSFAQETATEAAPSLSVPPLDVNICPDTHPIKGNRSGRQANRPVDPIYHVPSSRWYAVSDPEECFARVEDEEAVGYRAPLR